MEARFRYIAPLYGYDPTIPHIAVPASAERRLREMADDLVGSADLLAIYIPEGTDQAYNPGVARGRVVGAVRLLPMPATKTIDDYWYDDWLGVKRWPIGWPCAPAYAPPTAKCPSLRTLVEGTFGPSSFQPYVARFQHGPFEVDGKIGAELQKQFSVFPPL